MPYNPKSLANLKGAGRWKDKKKAAEAGVQSGIAKRSKKESEAMVDKFLIDLVEMAFSKSSLDDFKKKAMEAPNQAMRIVALNMANPRNSMATLQWLIERVKGKPKQSIESTLDASVQVSKPRIVFKDIEHGEK